MAILTDARGDLSKVRAASPEIENRPLHALLSQTEKNTDLAALDQKAKKLIERLLDIFEAG